jgi:hypothetical protein
MKDCYFSPPTYPFSFISSRTTLMPRQSQEDVPLINFHHLVKSGPEGICNYVKLGNVLSSSQPSIMFIEQVSIVKIENPPPPHPILPAPTILYIVLKLLFQPVVTRE